MLVLLLILLASILYTIFNVFVSKTGGALNSNLASGIFNGLGGIIPLAIYIATRTKGDIATTKAGLVYAILAGITISAFSVTLLNIFSRTQNVAFVLPAVYGGTVVLGGIAGIILNKDHLSTTTVAGLIVTTIGLGLIVYGRSSVS